MFLFNTYWCSIHIARFDVLTAASLKFSTSGTCCCFIGVVLAVYDVSNEHSAFIYKSSFDFLILKGKDLTFGLMTGNKIYPELVFSSTVVSGI